jgi:hypothetical protein
MEKRGNLAEKSLKRDRRVKSLKPLKMKPERVRTTTMKIQY